MQTTSCCTLVCGSDTSERLFLDYVMFQPSLVAHCGHHAISRVSAVMKCSFKCPKAPWGCPWNTAWISSVPKHSSHKAGIERQRTCSNVLGAVPIYLGTPTSPSVWTLSETGKKSRCWLLWGSSLLRRQLRKQRALFGDCGQGACLAPSRSHFHRQLNLRQHVLAQAGRVTEPTGRDLVRRNKFSCYVVACMMGYF